MVRRLLIAVLATGAAAVGFAAIAGAASGQASDLQTNDSLDLQVSAVVGGIPFEIL
ncbi:hypothetical protein GCM10029976_093820 [Kribbella albertanoniae]|uniref:hypothetical protein n=1 Tax=Kribbella albertanoniae TaxID=1266829 RepID=UPI001404D9C2|nr:hypothetical protein [Kribbella albertanoniae]